MPERVYGDFDLTIERDSSPGRSADYRVRVLGSPAGETGWLPVRMPFTPEYMRTFLADGGLAPDAEGGAPPGLASADAGWNGKRAQTVGHSLFQALMAGEIGAKWRGSVDLTRERQMGVRLRLRLNDAPELAVWPWELLFDEKSWSYLALSDWTPLVRYLEPGGPVRDLCVTPPLRVLVLVSKELDASQELGRLREELSPLTRSGLVGFEIEDSWLLKDLPKRLGDQEFHVLHVIGHGEFGRLRLSDPDGQPAHVSAERLGWRLADHRSLRLVVLNACEGARGDPGDPYSGTAQTLVRQGVPAVVAMQLPISDEASVTFARDFYAAIANRHPVDAAVAMARIGLEEHFSKDKWCEWATPVLYLRASDGHLFDIASRPDRSLLISYLQARVTDWDAPVWRESGQAPSAVERRLRVRQAAGETASGAILTEEQALEGARLLAVVGGPGSGKTWLARRYARRAAQQALTELQEGAPVHKVALPLLTTWDLWAKSPGGTKESLIEATFAAGSGHSPFDTEVTARLRRALADPLQSVLAVVDSLDEAADTQGQQSLRLAELASLSLTTWRVVVTSRPAAWDASKSSGRDGGGTVVEVQDLTYPDDVEGFIRSWFAGDPPRGDELAAQIRHRAELRRAASVPLLLTFYCLLTGHADQPTPLPARRWQLYADLVRALLLGEWRPTAPGLDVAPDPERCEDILRGWAWHAVKDQNTPAGLGAWGDAFVQPGTLSTELAAAIDHVAPKQSRDRRGRITRRFVHRTVLEHLVAEHVAGLPTKQAAAALLPHLWFDPDWEIAAPAAIAAHNRRHRGELLDELILFVASTPPGDLPRAIAGEEIDRFVLAIAEESETDEWTEQHQEVIHECRRRVARRSPAEAAMATHWHASNGDVLASCLTALPKAQPRVRGNLVAGILALEPKEFQRAQARTTLVAALSTVTVGEVGALVKALESLEISKLDWDHARADVLAALAAANPHVAERLGWVLAGLSPTGADRAKACAHLLDALAVPDPNTATRLIKAVLALAPTEADLAKARAAVMANLQGAAPLAQRLGILEALEITQADMEQTRADVLAALPAASPQGAERLVQALAALQPTPSDMAQARSALRDQMKHAEPHDARTLALTLSTLVVSDADRVEARAALLAVLNNPSNTVGDLFGVFPALVVTDQDLAQVREVLIAALSRADAPSRADAQAVAEIVLALSTLDPTEAQRALTLDALLAVLPHVDPLRHWALTGTLPDLVRSEGDRTRARAAVCAALLTADVLNLEDLLGVLPALVATDTDRAEARRALLAAVRTAGAQAAIAILPVVPTLEPLEQEERAMAREAILSHLPAADPADARTLVEALRRLSAIELWNAWLTHGRA